MKRDAKIIKVPVILGPTAVGKTSFACEIACELGMEIISCDSRQIYRYMDIGTAKPSKVLLDSIKHWMIDIVNPDEPFSAFLFAEQAQAILRDRAAHGKLCILCGGSGLYYQALSCGLGPAAAADKGIRTKYETMAATLGKDAVYERLFEVDPVTAKASHPSNLARNIRALEVFEITGEVLSNQKKCAVPPADIEFFPIVLTLDRPDLYARINTRVHTMIKDGLIEEFRMLVNKAYHQESPGMRCVGYKELFDVENNLTSVDRAIELIQQNTRHYAKRQITWFRHQVEALEIICDTAALWRIKESISSFLQA